MHRMGRAFSFLSYFPFPEEIGSRCTRRVRVTRKEKCVIVKGLGARGSDPLFLRFAQLFCLSGKA